MTSTTKLAELARLIEKEQIFSQHGQSQALELSRLRKGNELLARLSWAARQAYLELLECANGDSVAARREFTTIFEEIRTLIASIFRLVEDKGCPPASNAVTTITYRSRSVIIEFLTRLRNDHTWVAQRLSLLSATDFESFLPACNIPWRQSSSLRESTTERTDFQDLYRSDLQYSLVLGLFAAPGMSSHDDELRLGLSARILCQLIGDNKTSSKADQFCLSMMDFWCSMYGWEASQSFEVMLLDLLQSGTKIIQRAEARISSLRPHNRNYYFSYQARDDVEEEYFTDAVKRVFELLDDQAIGGLPQGVLILAQAILAQVPEADRRHYETFIIINWFFNRFLSRAITTPESLGLVNDYLISDAKRHGILHVLQQKVHGYCAPSTTHQNSSIRRTTSEEEIEGHVISIFSKFRNKCNTRLLPQLRPLFRKNHFTPELHETVTPTRTAFINICSQQITFLYNILCNNTIRSTSPESHEAHQLIRQTSTSSAASARSMINQTARSSRLIFDVGGPCTKDKLPNTAEDKPSHKVELSNESTSVESNFPGLEEFVQGYLACVKTKPTGLDLRGDWETIYSRSGVLKLHETIRVPQIEETSTSSGAKLLQSALHHFLHHFELKNFDNTLVPTNSYFPEYCSNGHYGDMVYKSINDSNLSDISDLPRKMLLAGQHFLNHSDYIAANMYFQAHTYLKSKAQSPDSCDDFSPLLHSLCIEQEILSERAEISHEDVLAACTHALLHKRQLQKMIDEQVAAMNKLRTRMWYICDLRKTKSWSQASEVIKCLYRMRPNVAVTGNSSYSSSSVDQFAMSGLKKTRSRDRRFTRFPREVRPVTPCSSFFTGLASLDQGVYEALTGPTDTVIENKLGGDQSLQTLKWMQENDVHNFCAGEERLQRLCFELDELVMRFTSPDIHAFAESEMEEAVSSPIWEVDFFAHESSTFRIPAQNRDRRHPDLIPTAGHQDRNGFGGLLRRGSAGDLLNFAQTTNRSRGNSVGSLDHPRRHATSRTSSSPTQSQSIRPTNLNTSTHLSDDRSRSRSEGTGSANVNHIKKPAAQDIEEFVRHVKSILITLLISDFADSLFWHGSETDEWLNDELTESVTARQIRVDTRKVSASDHRYHRPLETERLTDLPVKISPVRPRHRRTKSSSISPFFGGTYLSASLKSALVPPSIDIGSHRNSVESAGMARTNSFCSYLDVPSIPDVAVSPLSQRQYYDDYHGQPQKLPLLKAYSKILHRFSVHPSPYEKLHALHNFGSLVVASLVPDVLTEHSKGPPGTDVIIEEFQRLLRIVDLRPKTLYRDLQYIASFVPARILNMTDEGKIFWDFALAALAIKREVVDALVEHASTIIENQTFLELIPGAQSTDTGSTTSDAIILFGIGAKENNPRAMREFGCLLLDKPALCKTSVPPFSDPSSIFRRKGDSEVLSAVETDMACKRLAARVWFERAVCHGDAQSQEWLEKISQ